MTSVADLRLVALLLVGLLAGCGSFDSVQSPYNRGVYLESIADYRGAIVEFRKAVDETPEDDRARFNLAFALDSEAARTTRSDESSAKKMREEAATLYRALADQEPTHLRAAVNLAALLIETTRVTDGLAWLERAHRDHPDSGWPLVAMAAQRLREDLPIGARDGTLASRDLAGLLAEARERLPGDPWAAWLSGVERERNGTVEEARAHYAEGLRATPRDLALLLAEARLDLAEAQAALAPGPTQDLMAADGALAEATSKARLVWGIRPESYLAHRVLGEVRLAQADLAARRARGEDVVTEPETSERDLLEAALAHEVAAAGLVCEARAAWGRGVWGLGSWAPSDQSARIRALHERLAAAW